MAAPPWATPFPPTWTLERVRGGVVLSTHSLAPGSGVVLGKEGDIPVLHESVSRRHALLCYGLPPGRPGRPRPWVIDLASTHGTRVGKSETLAPHTPTPLPPGAPLHLGASTSHFVLMGGGGEEEEEAGAPAPRPKKVDTGITWGISDDAVGQAASEGEEDEGGDDADASVAAALARSRAPGGGGAWGERAGGHWTDDVNLNTLSTGDGDAVDKLRRKLARVKNLELEIERIAAKAGRGGDLALSEGQLAQRTRATKQVDALRAELAEEDPRLAARLAGKGVPAAVAVVGGGGGGAASGAAVHAPPPLSAVDAFLAASERDVDDRSHAEAASLQPRPMFALRAATGDVLGGRAGAPALVAVPPPTSTARGAADTEETLTVKLAAVAEKRGALLAAQAAQATTTPSNAVPEEEDPLEAFMAATHVQVAAEAAEGLAAQLRGLDEEEARLRSLLALAQPTAAFSFTVPSSRAPKRPAEPIAAPPPPKRAPVLPPPVIVTAVSAVSVAAPAPPPAPPSPPPPAAPPPPPIAPVAPAGGLSGVLRAAAPKPPPVKPRPAPSDEPAEEWVAPAGQTGDGRVASVVAKLGGRY